MALARYNGNVQDEAGNAVENALIEVRSNDTGFLARIFSGRDGTPSQQLPNPFVSPDSNFFFHTVGGEYRITASKGGFSKTWNRVPIGTAQAVDVEELILSLESGIIPTQTKAELDDLAPSGDDGETPLGGVVYADPDPTLNGYYTYNYGTSQWVWARPLPDTLARLTIDSTSGNQLNMQAAQGVDPGAVVAFIVDVGSWVNTGPVSISINGAPPLPAKDVNGDDFAPGVFTGRLFLSNEGDRLQAIIGGDIMAAVSAAQGFATLSQRWAEGTEPGGPGTKSSREWSERSLEEADRSFTEANRSEAAASSAEYTNFGLGEISAREPDLDTLRGTRMFGVPGGAVGSPQPGADGVGWQVEEVGQRSQIVIMTQSSIYMRTDDSQPQPDSWGPWYLIYSQGSLVGSVSQVGGVPTGRVIERGDNANGEYVRFADGTQICWHSIGPRNVNATSGGYYFIDVGTWDFPAAFSSVPRVTTAVNRGAVGTGLTWPGATTHSISGSSIGGLCIVAVASGVTGAYMQVMAIGRWF